MSRLRPISVAVSRMRLAIYCPQIKADPQLLMQSLTSYCPYIEADQLLSLD